MLIYLQGPSLSPLRSHGDQEKSTATGGRQKFHPPSKEGKRTIYDCGQMDKYMSKSGLDNQTCRMVINAHALSGDWWQVMYQRCLLFQCLYQWFGGFKKGWLSRHFTEIILVRYSCKFGQMLKFSVYNLNVDICMSFSIHTHINSSYL